MSDVKTQSKKWFYTDIVKDHFLKPRNIATDDAQIDKLSPNGVGEVGSPACGDVMKMWLKIENDRIVGCLWRTFGCASAIASTSMLSVMLTENGGMKIEDALKIKPKDIMDRLGGLPPIKIHCSVLGDQALLAAVNNYFENTGQKERMMDIPGRVCERN